MKVQANGLQLEVEDSGPPQAPAVLLIMGLGMQMVAWPPEFVQPLLQAGYRVVRMDNRDVGLSQGFEHAPPRNMLWEGLRHRFGLPVRAPYPLQDMANDALGVLDALGIARAHVIGASMGGMIAQRVAATAPARVLSLTSIMSSSGARGLPGPRPEIARALLRRPAGRDEDSLVAFSLNFIRLISGPVYAHAPAALEARVRDGIRRAYRPDGLQRQLLSIVADTDRADVLARIQCPTLVLHGDADHLVPPACGADTARRIPGARLHSVPGMGHDLPPAVSALLLAEILPFLRGASPDPGSPVSP